MSRLRLNRWLALAGVASRRRCDEIILAGRVRVDGETAASPGLSIDPAEQVVTLDGRVLRAEKPATYLLNKPPGVLSSALDRHGGRTVLDLAREAGLEERLFPVGRLDKDSRGLILLSNEGELALRLIHPRYGVEKIYEVLLDAALSPAQMRRFAAGLELSEGRTRPCRILARPGPARYRVHLQEGRKRQIRRMCEILGRRVLDLERIQMGPITLGRLAAGRIRPLTERELRQLKNAVGLG